MTLEEKRFELLKAVLPAMAAVIYSAPVGVWERSTRSIVTASLKMVEEILNQLSATAPELRKPAATSIPSYGSGPT